MKELNKPAVEKLWTPAFILITTAFLFCSTSQQMINNTFALLIDSLGGSATFSGITAGVFAVSAIISRAASGRIADRHTRKIVLIAGGIIYFCAVIGFAISRSFWVLLILRLIQGCGYATFNNAQTIVASDVIPKQRMAEGMGYFTIGLAFSSAVGSKLAIAVMGDGRFALLYCVTAGVIGLAFLCCMLCRYQEPPKVPKVKESLGQIIKSSIEVKALPASIIALFSYMGMAVGFNFLTLYASRRGFTNVGTFYMIAAVMVFVSKLFAGKLRDRFGTFLAMVPFALSGTAAFLIMALSSDKNVFLLCGALYGMFLGSMLPILNSEAIQASPPDRRGAAVATFYIFVDATIGFGAILLGAITDRFGFSATFITASVCIMIALILSGILYGGKRSGRKKTSYGQQ